MTLRDMLVQIGRGRAGEARLDAALALARAFDARLTALCLVPVPYVIAGDGVQLPRGLLARQREEAEAAADGLLAEVLARADRAGVRLETRRETGPIDDAPRLLARHARHADLVMVGQPDPNDPDGFDADLAEAAFLASGRPALVVPFIGARAMPPERVLVAWDGSREAARAAHDALPLLRRAARVSLVVVDPQRLAGAVGEQPGADMAAHLARHGVVVEAAVVPGGGGLTVADALLSRAADDGADLLVMGGYGHSRLRETVLGGATRQMLGQMTVPVLFAH